MQLSSLLRPEKVKKRWEEKRTSSEEYVFKMYDEILKEAVIDQTQNHIELPIDYEGLCRSSENYYYPVLNAFSDGEDYTQVAKQAVDNLKEMGWSVDSYVEDGCMVIDLEAD